MTVTPERIREIFKSLENSDAASFFERVADNVDSTVMGTHPLAGHYDSKKAFIEGTFAKLVRFYPKGRNCWTRWPTGWKVNPLEIKQHSRLLSMILSR